MGEAVVEAAANVNILRSSGSSSTIEADSMVLRRAGG